MNDQQSVNSPCISVCVLGPKQWCLGCGRDTDEITGWANKTPAEQQNICERAKQRIHADRARSAAQIKAALNGDT